MYSNATATCFQIAIVPAWHRFNSRTPFNSPTRIVENL